MSRRPIDLLLLFIVVRLCVIAGVLFALALLAWVLLAPSVAAATPVWRGEVRDAPAASWWFAEGLLEPPVVVVEGGTGGLGACEDDGSGTALRCTVYAQGEWREVTADGVLVATRWRVALPMIGAQ